MELSAKTMAYVRAAEVVRSAKAERNRYDRKTAAAINSELQKIAQSLTASAHRNHTNEYKKQMLDAAPELKERYELACRAARFHRARKTIDKIANNIRQKREAESK